MKQFLDFLNGNKTKIAMYYWAVFVAVMGYFGCKELPLGLDVVGTIINILSNIKECDNLPSWIGYVFGITGAALTIAGLGHSLYKGASNLFKKK